jgi:hypothetical protein
MASRLLQSSRRKASALHKSLYGAVEPLSLGSQLQQAAYATSFACTSDAAAVSTAPPPGEDHTRQASTVVASSDRPIRELQYQTAPSIMEVQFWQTGC